MDVAIDRNFSDPLIALVGNVQITRAVKSDAARQRKGCIGCRAAFTGESLYTVAGNREDIPGTIDPKHHVVLRVSYINKSRRIQSNPGDIAEWSRSGGSPLRRNDPIPAGHGGNYIL
jgi:hypothetical protein